MEELTVASANHVRAHVLSIKYSDGSSNQVDFAPFIFTADHPDYEQFKSIDTFKQFKVEDGNINWDDYTMIFPVEDLYHNTILPSAFSQSA